MFRATPLIVTFVIALGLGIGAAQDGAPDPPAALKVGDDAPEIDLSAAVNRGDEETPKKLSEYEGKKNVLVVFVDKAYSRHTVTQFVEYQEAAPLFEKAETVIVGINPDEQAENNMVKKKYNLPFTLLGDPANETVKKYGVAVHKVRGKDLPHRAVFLVDKEGKLQYIDTAYQMLTGKPGLYSAVEALGTKKAE